MKHHQVLALKYRPASFEQLIGQESVVQTLSLALSNDRLSHAYLFSGLRGSGKTSTARIFAKALLCEEGPTSHPCEICEQCLGANENRHIDIIEMDAASNRGIDDIRELIESTKYKPNMARFKIFIIDEVHMLTTQAFNALLKTLEEPPPYIKFILATTDPLKLPSTILSRVQHFRFKQIKSEDVINHLCHILNLENIEFDKKALEMLTRAGNGSLRDTLTLLDQAIIYSKGYVTPEAVATMLGLLEPSLIEHIFTAITTGNRKSVLEMIKTLEGYECDVVIDEMIASLKQAFFNEDKRFSMLVYERFFKILSESKSLLHLNANNGFVLALLFFKMMEAMSIKRVEEMIESLENQKIVLPQAPLCATSPLPTQTPEREKPPLGLQGLFQKVCLKLYDRNAELGSCFEQQVRCLSFEEGLLRLSSRAQGEESTLLKHHSGLIKHFVQEVFGIETRIDIVKEAPLQEMPYEHDENENTGSMLESIEYKESSESCVATPNASNTPEIDVKEILNHPFIQKAQELFEPKKIEIHPKV